MKNSPLISVILPVYNAENHLAEAIQSILNQTFTDFELLLINDGSNDDSVRVMNFFKDQRIRIIHNEANLGLITTLNKGVNLANGQYIARMDADDIALPNRFEVQVSFLEKNSDIDILGSNFECFGASSLKSDFPLLHDEICLQLYFENTFGHPTIMFRKKSLAKHGLIYDKNFVHTEDWALWIKSMLTGLKFANISEILLRYRVGEQSITVQNQHSRKERYLAIYSLVVDFLNIPPSKANLNAHYSLSFGKISGTEVDLIRNYLPLLQTELFKKFADTPVRILLDKKLKRVIFRFADSEPKKAKKFAKEIGYSSPEIRKYIFKKILFRK